MAVAWSEFMVSHHLVNTLLMVKMIMAIWVQWYHICLTQLCQGCGKQFLSYMIFFLLKWLNLINNAAGCKTSTIRKTNSYKILQKERIPTTSMASPKNHSYENN
jgi:hypothetical protein